MSPATVVQLRPRARIQAPAQKAPRVIAAFSAALLRAPSRPVGFEACVAYLQLPADLLCSRQMGLRALRNLRTSLFVAPGRDGEMALLWREALATACYARAVAIHAGFDVPLLAGAALLHRTCEISALRALARAERDAGQRLAGPVMQLIMEARDDDLAARVTRNWALRDDLRMLVLQWREEQERMPARGAVALLTLAQALATEVVHAATCAPGLADAARDALGLPQAMLASARATTGGIEALLLQVAPPAV